MSTRSRSARWSSLVLACSIVAGAGLVPAMASAKQEPSALADISKNAYSFVNNIRGFYFCGTTTCKKNRTAEGVASKAGLKGLAAEAKNLATFKVASSVKATASKFIADVNSLEADIKSFNASTSAEAIAQYTGMIYYDSANVGSDSYLLTCDYKHTTVKYAQWSVGAVAVLYAMQLDTQTLDAKTSTAAVDIYASDNLEAEATALLADANGPSSQFNGLLRTFAHIQLEVSPSEILLLQNKKAPLSTTRLTALTKQLGSTFKQIADLQNKLAKQA